MAVASRSEVVARSRPALPCARGQRAFARSCPPGHRRRRERGSPPTSAPPPKRGRRPVTMSLTMSVLGFSGLGNMQKQPGPRRTTHRNESRSNSDGRWPRRARPQSSPSCNPTALTHAPWYSGSTRGLPSAGPDRSQRYRWIRNGAAQISSIGSLSPRGSRSGQGLASLGRRRARLRGVDPGKQQMGGGLSRTRGLAPCSTSLGLGLGARQSAPNTQRQLLPRPKHRLRH